MHLAEMEATKAGMPVVCVNHGDGPNVKDIHMENFSISVGGRELIVDGTVTLSFGRHYGEFALFFNNMFSRFLMVFVSLPFWFRDPTALSATETHAGDSIALCLVLHRCFESV